MKAFRRIVSAQLLECAQSRRTAVALLFGLGMACYYGSFYLRYANEVALPINPLDAYIVCGSCRVNFTCVTLFPLLLLCFDTPFLSDRSAYEIARVGKGKWLGSKLAFLVLVTLLYNLLLLAFLVLLAVSSARELSWAGWSPAMERLCKLTVPYYSGALFFYFPALTESTSPGWVAVLTLLFNSAYCLLLCLVITACNCRWDGVRGWMAAAAVHILGFVIINNGSGFLFWLDFSLLECALPVYCLEDAGYTGAVLPAAVFAGLLLSLGLAAMRAKRRIFQ